jgi:hypothetical protein
MRRPPFRYQGLPRKEPPDAPPSGGSANGFRRADPGRSLLSPSSAAVRHQPRPTDGDVFRVQVKVSQPRPMNGIVVAVMVMN